MELNWLTPEARLFLKGGYLHPNETAEERYEFMADYLEQKSGIEGFSDKVKGYIEKNWLSFASPEIANLGRDKGLPASCNFLKLEDTMESIASGEYEMSMLASNGAGTARNFSNIRAKGEPYGVNGRSVGVLSWIESYATKIAKVSQNGMRRGFLTAYLSVDHKEIWDFLKIGREGHHITNITTGVTIPEGWMEQMIAGDKDKQAIFLEIHKSRSEVGYPYILFVDNCQKGKHQVYVDNGDIVLDTSNICVHGETKILTEQGYVDIEKLEDETLNVWNGEEWSEVDVIKTGVGKELLEVVTDSGYSLKCTPQHKFYVQKGYSRGTGANKLEILEKQANELEAGDKLIKFDLPIISGQKELEFAYDNGFLSGDGSERGNSKKMYLYDKKKALAPHIKSVSNWGLCKTTNRLQGTAHGLKNKYFVPDASYSIKSRLDWLAGYLDADGTVTVNSTGSETIQAASVEYGFLKEIQLMLQTLGCDSKVTFSREAGEYLLPNNNSSIEGKNSLYNCKEVNRLLINGNSLYKLLELGINFNRLKPSGKKPNRECSQFIKIKEVNKVEGLHDVYCFTEYKRHMGMFNGILTGQCTECIEYTDADKEFLCVLASANLEHFDEWVNTDFIFDMNIILDIVVQDYIDKAKHISGHEKSVKFAEEHRSIGIGVMGFHTYLQKKDVAFGSLPSHYLNENIFKYIREQSDRASKWMAKNWGSAPYLKGKYEDRNTSRIAIAPTKSSSAIMGFVSQGIEPIKNNYHTKDLAKVQVEWRNPQLMKVLDSYGKNDEATWLSILENGGSVQHLKFMTDDDKDVYKTSTEIGQMDILKLAAGRQKYIDQSQSLNLTIPKGAKAKDVLKLTVEAWRMGIKTLYYQYSINASREATRDLLTCDSCEA